MSEELTTINITKENKAWFLSLKTNKRDTANDIMDKLRREKQNKTLIA